MNAHMIQLPPIPSRRITSVKKFALSVAVVAATIENPMSHHGIECPELKKWFAVPRLRSEASAGISARTAKNPTMTAQSNPFNSKSDPLPYETLDHQFAKSRRKRVEIGRKARDAHHEIGILRRIPVRCEDFLGVHDIDVDKRPPEGKMPVHKRHQRVNGPLVVRKSDRSEE